MVGRIHKWNNLGKEFSLLEDFKLQIQLFNIYRTIQVLHFFLTAFCSLFLSRHWSISFKLLHWWTLPSSVLLPFNICSDVPYFVPNIGNSCFLCTSGSMLFIFSKNHLLLSVIFSIVFLLSISFICLVVSLLISYVCLLLDLTCSTFFWYDNQYETFPFFCNISI